MCVDTYMHFFYAGHGSSVPLGDYECMHLCIYVCKYMNKSPRVQFVHAGQGSGVPVAERGHDEHVVHDGCSKHVAEHACA
jgi:hypothetical protein